MICIFYEKGKFVKSLRFFASYSLRSLRLKTDFNRKGRKGFAKNAKLFKVSSFYFWAFLLELCRETIPLSE